MADPDFGLELVDLDAEIARHGDATEVESQRKAATALLRKSGILGRLGRFDEAVALLGELAARYGDAADDEVRHDVVRGLEVQAKVLEQLGLEPEARAALERARELGREWIEPPVEAMQTLYDRALALEREGCDADALMLLADLVNTWPDGPPDEVVPVTIRGMLRAAALMPGLGPNLDQAFQMYDEIVRRYGTHSDPEVRALVSRAIFDRAWVLAERERFDEAVAACTEALEYLGDATDAKGRVRVAVTLNWRADWQDDAGRGEAAAADRRALLERFPDGESAEIDAQLDVARAALGLTGT